MSTPTIAAIATPPGTGAIALVRVSGPAAGEVAARVFVGRRRANWEARRQHFGRIVDASGQTIDEVLLTYFPAPGTFTGEDLVEVSCHGGVLVTRRILEAFFSAGAEPAAPGEFSQRAFLNGRLDLTQAEAIMDLISAKTDLALKAAGEQLAGRLSQEIEKIRTDLVTVLAHVEAYIDFPDEDIEPEAADSLVTRLDHLGAALDHLLATSEQGRILREGLRTVICGPPNAGKSSLLNALLGFDRAIVSDTAGTTRDTIEEYINLGGVPLRLVDTAGLRESEDGIEQEGITRSRQQISGADLILHVVDGSTSAEGVERVAATGGAKLALLLNKSDLPLHPDWEGSGGIPTTSFDTASIAALRERLHGMVVSGTGMEAANLTAINARHQHCLKRARADVAAARNLLVEGESPEFVAADLRAALDAVGEVVGRTDIEEILGEIFSTFCIGK